MTTTMHGSDIEYVVLRDGPAIPIAALRLALTLEERGLRIVREADVLVVGPKALLTADDRSQIRRWKSELLQLAAYEAPWVQ